jgi:hypothetical protein
VWDESEWHQVPVLNPNPSPNPSPNPTP